MGALAIIWFLARDKYDWIAYYANLLLAVVGLVGVAVGVCTVLFIRGQVIEMRRQRLVMQRTLVSINRQAGHMEAQTKELSRQNRNMLAAERAWVIESVRFLDDIPYRPPTGGGIVVAILTLKNIGKQPAFLKLLQTRFHASERLANSPEFQSTEVFPEGYMLAPRQTRYVRVVLEQGSFNDEQVRQIRGESSPVLPLYIYGCVVYESVGVRGVNNFCYKWRNLQGLTLEGDRPGFDKSGPDGYNRHI